MSENQEFTMYEGDGQSAATVTVVGEAGDQPLQQIQYITQDGTVVPADQIVGSGNNVIQVNGLSSQQEQVILQTSQSQSGQAQQTVVQGATSGGVGTPNTLGIPQMLFLNQITVNGQTSFVLVDSSNKPVQLPQGIQVINLPSQQQGAAGGQPIAMPGETGEEPLYVNAKQYHRILKRRQARAKLESLGRIPKERQKYLYESRHRHAINRRRGLGGVFVNSDKTGQDGDKAMKVELQDMVLPVVTQSSDLILSLDNT